MTAFYLRWATAASACVVLAACGSSGDGIGATPAPSQPNTLAERFDTAEALRDRVDFLFDAEGVTRTARLPRGTATYRGQAGFVLAADEAEALALLNADELEVEDLAWLARATLNADFERYTIDGRFDDFMGQRNEAIGGTLNMQSTAIVTNASNEAGFVGNVSGTLSDGRGPINVVAVGAGDFIGARGQAVSGALLGSAARPGEQPQALGGRFAGER